MPDVYLKAIRPKKFKVIDPGHVSTELRAAMRLYLNQVKLELIADYAKVPPGKTYIRTRDLARGWKIRIPSDNFGELTNSVRYAVYVQGPHGGGRASGSRQAAFHRRRGWQSVSDVARRTRKQYVQLMNRAVRPRILTV